MKRVFVSLVCLFGWGPHTYLHYLPRRRAYECALLTACAMVLSVGMGSAFDS